MERYITIAQGKKIFIASKRIGHDAHYSVIAEASNEVSANKILDALNAEAPAQDRDTRKR